MKRVSLTLVVLLSIVVSLKAQQYVSTAPANRNAVLEEFTGRTCSSCPDGHKVANQIKANHPDRFWSVNIHSSGWYSLENYPNLNTVKGNQIRAAFDAQSFPTGVVNRSTATAVGRSYWTGQVNSQLMEAAECNVAGEVVINPLTRMASITVEVYYTANSLVEQNYLTVVMLQDSIWGSQSYGQENPEQWLNGQYCHMHILRDVVTDVMGDAISPTTQGALVTRTYEYQIPEIIGEPNGVEVDLNNIHFLAWVTERSQGTPTRPVLNVGELGKVFGTGEPIFPIINSIELLGLNDCDQSKTAEVVVQNIGEEILTSMKVAAEFGAETFSVNWEGELLPNTTGKVSLPVIAPFGTNDITITIIEANGLPYEFSLTKTMTCMEWLDLEIQGETEELSLELMQDKFGNQITWEFTSPDGAVLASGGPYAMLSGGTSTQLHVEQFIVHADECVKFTIHDEMGNGICCTYGQGYYIVKDSHGNVLFGDQDNGAFGEQASHLFSVKTQQVGVEEENPSLSIYPNPAIDVLNIQSEGMTGIEVFNTVGQRVMIQTADGNSIQLKTEGLNNGIYSLRVHAKDGIVMNRTFSVVR